jgi:group I intron endonuclease
MKICGVYKITNKIDDKFYIGSSIDIERRWKSHKIAAKSPKYNHLELYKDFNLYGFDNFEFEILEKCEPEKRLEREKDYIVKLNARQYGYNGQGLEKHHNHKLTLEEVEYIRTQYDNRMNKDDIYYEFEDKINYTGFHKVWHGYSWQEVMPEVYSEENKNWHYKNGQSRPGSQNGRAKLNENDVKAIRDRKRNKESMASVYEDYKDRVKFGSFKNIRCYVNWKHIQ